MTISTMQPLGNKVLIKDVIEQEKKSEGGIILDAVKSPLRKVEIVAVSEDLETKLKAGDVCLADYGGTEIEKGVWLCNDSILQCKI